MIVSLVSIAQEGDYDKEFIRLTLPKRQIIDSFTRMNHYTVQYNGDRALDVVYTVSLPKTITMKRFLDCMNYYGDEIDWRKNFVYTIENKKITIDNYYTYEVGKKGNDTSYIKTYFDKKRQCKVLAFKNVQPSIVLDSLLKLYDRPEKNRTDVNPNTTVTGLIPLQSLSTIQSIVFTPHNWGFYRENNNIVIGQKK